MLFKILFIGASATTGLFAGLWWTERDAAMSLNARLKATQKAHQRALEKMTDDQLFALLQDAINDLKFHEIVHNQ